VWNYHWHTLSPTGGGEPTGAIADAINSSLDHTKFKEDLSLFR
jgi:Fe-Mn family superoxide dismutase